MSVCRKCGGYIDEHPLTVHVCKNEIEKVEIKYIESSTINEGCSYGRYKIKRFGREEYLTWKDVLDGYKLYPMDFYQICKIANDIGYIYVAFNGRVYHRDDIGMKNILMSEFNL